MLASLIIALAWLFQVTLTACPCAFNPKLGELTCDAGSQSSLPFHIPDCLSWVENNQVERLILTEQNFPQIINGAFSWFKNLVHLDLSYSNIEKIDEYSLDENIKIKNIELRGNNLVTFPALYTSTNNSLQSLVLRHNKLEILNLSDLDDLIFLDLDDNSMTEAALTNALINVPNLYQLSAESNKITSVDKSMFSEQTMIELISLWNNEIEYIQPGSFDQLVNLQSLDLKSNPLVEYQTDAWHFCHNLHKGSLTVNLDDNKRVIQDLKVDQNVDAFCEAEKNYEPSIPSYCSNDNGHLFCFKNIGDILCQLRELEFKSITFLFPKDEQNINVDDFFEAETNSYFKDLNKINGKADVTQYLPDLKLYGTKFDLASLDEHLGLRTKTVQIFADTVYMSRPLQNPIKSQISIRARVISISEDIPMNMTKQQLFEKLEADQPVDSWASVQEVVTDVGNATFSVKKLGFMEVQREFSPTFMPSSSKECFPKIFTVFEYEAQHHTKPEVFFDRVQLNLLRMAVRTLGATKRNDALAINMANHALMKTTNSNIIKDKKAYLVTQKLIHDKEVILSHKRNIPFYNTNLMSTLAGIMFDKMSLYAANETVLMMKLDNALSRMVDMNKNFEEARLLRELYFETELATLEEIWNSTDSAWHWDFDGQRNMEESIQDSIQKNGEEMFEMEKNDLEDMLEKARDTVESDQAVVNKFKSEIDRYSTEARLSLEFQRQKLKDTREAGVQVTSEKEQFDSDIQKWQEEQMLKAVFGFLKGMVGIVGGIATMQPEIAGAAVAEGAATAGAAADFKEVMESIVELIKALSELEKMLDEIFGIENIDVNIPDIGSDDALDAAIDWREALENAYYMKNFTDKFHDMEILGRSKIESVGRATDYEVDPAELQQALSTYNDRGSQLIQETVSFAKLMMHLADLAGELEVAEMDLENAIAQVGRIEQMLQDLREEHIRYHYLMELHRHDYENKCDEFEEAYQANSTAAKEAFRQNITELFEKFREAFEDSNNQYITMMNELTSALYTKVASVHQHSMVQRSLIGNLYTDFCDGLFYFSFTECYKDNPTEQYVPTMSEDFGTLLEKLKEIQWDSITSAENLPNLPTPFSDVSIYLMDEHLEGLYQMFGPATSLRTNGEAYFNFRYHNSYLDDFYRVRINSVTVHLLDIEGNILVTPANEIIKFLVHFPLEFADKDVNENIYEFRGMEHFCPADYFINNSGEIINISSCEVDYEFDGVNHKTSHDGVFKVVAKNIKQEILNNAGGIKVTVGGSYATKAERN